MGSLKGKTIQCPAIFGPDVGSLKGNTTQYPATHIEEGQALIPMKVQQLYKDSTHDGEIMKVNQIPFMVGIS